MRTSPSVFVGIALAALASGCSRHYRDSLEAYREADSSTYMKRTLDWVDRSEARRSDGETEALPIDPQESSFELEIEDPWMKSIREVFYLEAVELEGRLGLLDDPEELDSILASELEWADLALAVAVHNPAIQAAHSRWEAALRQYDQAAYLDDLIGQFRTFTRYLNIPVEKPLHQSMIQSFFPYPSTISLKGEIVRAQVALAEIDWQRVMRDQVISAGLAYFELQYLKRAFSTTEINIALVDNLLAVVEERYRTGATSQADLLRVQTELERQRNFLNDLESRSRSEIVAITSLVDREGGAFNGSIEDTDLASPQPSASDLEAEGLNHRQELRAQGERVERNRFSIRLGEVMGRPLASQGFSFFERGMGPEASEAASRESFGLSPKFPLRPAYAQAEAYLAEMRRRLSAEELTYDDIANETISLAEDLAQEMDIALREAQLIREIVLPQDESAYETTLSGYTSGEQSFIDLLDAERELIKARLEAHEADRNLNHSLLRLALVNGRVPLR